MAAFTPISDATSYANQLSPSATGYLNKKWGLWSGTADDEGQKGVADTLNDINRIIAYKGGNQISDISQTDSALAPLIAKRNSGGIGSILKVALPIALGFAAGPLGGALAGTALGTTLGTVGTSALAGAGIGGLSSALTGGNVLKGALMGGATGGLSLIHI